MDALNGFFNGLFNILLAPIDELFGLGALITISVVSLIFMPFAMLFFKAFSSQKGIAAAKGKVKGHMIEIRIFQDDLVVVCKAVFKVLYYNLKYLFLNLAPLIPLTIPFIFVVAQLMVRFSYAPIPVEERDINSLLGGQGVTIEVTMADGHEAEALDLEIVLPPTLAAVSKAVPSGSDGVVIQEVAAVAAGAGDIEVRSGGQVSTKRVVTGGDEQIERLMQPERSSDLITAWMWPAEPTFGSDSPIASIKISYPGRELKWMPDGDAGVFLMFLILGLVFGVAAIKVFDIQI